MANLVKKVVWNARFQRELRDPKARAKILQTLERLRLQFEPFLDNFPNGDLEAIEKILGLKSPNRDLRSQLAISIASFRARARMESSQTSRVRDRVLKLSTHARAIRNEIKLLAGPTNWDQPYLGDLFEMDRLLNEAGIDYASAIGMMDAFCSAADLAKREGHRGGRPPIPLAWKEMMLHLAAVYEEAMHKRAAVTVDSVNDKYAGAFYQIAQIVDRAAATATQSKPCAPSILGARLRRILKAPRENQKKDRRKDRS